MASIVPGTDGTFKSSTAENTLLEVLMFLQLAERDAVKNPARVNYITGSFNSDTGSFGGGFQLPVNQQLMPDGSLVLTANTYLSGISITPGTGTPTFNAGTAEAYLFEVVNYIQALEANESINPEGQNLVSATYSSDTGVFQGTYSLPCTMALQSNGSIQLSAQPYLL